MVSQIKVNEIIKQSGSSITIGESGDTITLTGSTVTMPSGATLSNFPDNTPAFFAYAGANQTITNNTWTKININTEDLDTDSTYDHSTNYRFTPAVAGKYLFNFGANIFTSSQTDINYIQVAVYKNGSSHVFMYDDYQASRIYGSQTNGSCTITSDTDDYFELYARCQSNSGGNPVVQGHSGRVTFFGAIKVIGA